MKKIFFSSFLISLLSLTASSFAQSYDELVENYINQYRGIAVDEMQRTGIPASIILAQGIIESNAGQSPLSTDANNHFGIKCHEDWAGNTYTYDDDRKNECFRKYECALDSYKDHSDFLRNKGRYSILFTYDPNDYKAWAKGLKACGYATNPQYANILIKCIDDYDLHQWDLKPGDREEWFAVMNRSKINSTISETGNPEVVNASPSNSNAAERIFIFNDIKCVTLHDGESLNDLATAYQIGMKRLMRYNDIVKAEQLIAGDRVYLQPKRHNGDIPFEEVKAGETMFSISRDHGIQLDKLYEKNLMKPGMEPATGELISLRETRKEIPATSKIDSTVQKLPVETKTDIETPEYYVVSKGDTLYSLSKKYNLTIEELKSMNRLKSADLHVGERLIVTR